MAAITPVTGGICAPQGFQASGVHCGITKKVEKKDLGLIFSTVPCACAAVYTQNVVKAAPIQVTKQHLSNGRAQAVICNSGNANACNADGLEVAQKMCALTAARLEIDQEDVVVASTGVIGQPLSIYPIDAGLAPLAVSLSETGSQDCVQAIMTTDTTEKEIAISFEIGETLCTLGGISKGSGMIHPNMATMLAFLTTDVAISPAMLDRAMKMVVADTFNMISVDGDTSTNDMAVILANGLAGNSEITAEGSDFDTFVLALTHVCIYLARMMAKDGEGATKLLECSVTGAPTHAAARLLAKSVITSSLFKAAIYGADANWGRVLCAMGYSGAEFDPEKVSVRFNSRAGDVTVCEDGAGLPFSEDIAKEVLSEDEIEIHIALGQGDGSAVAWGCDLTYDYVKINGDYRS